MHDENTPPLADATPDEAYDIGWITGYDKAVSDAAPLEPGQLAALTRALKDPDLMLGTQALMTEVERRRQRTTRPFWSRTEADKATEYYAEALAGAHAYDRLFTVIEKITGVQA